MSLQFSSGADVVAALRVAAAKRGVPVTDFVRPVSASPSAWLSMIAQARMPKPLTLERARALIEGRPIPGIGRAGSIAAEVAREIEAQGERRVAARRLTARHPLEIVVGDKGFEAGAVEPVDREPCFRCGTRGDIGCAHRPRPGVGA